MPDAFSAQHVYFVSSALEPGDLFLLEMDGVERISAPYEYDLVVQTTFNGPLDLAQVDALLAQGAFLGFGPEYQHKVFGAVRSVEMLSMSPGQPTTYRLRLVPNLYDLRFTAGSWVYLDKTVPEIVKEVLKEAGLTEGTDFDFRVSGAYPKREYVLQYEETDLDFISRLLEHEGISFFFEHGDEREKVVFVDRNGAFAQLEGYESITYDGRDGVTDPRESITALNRTQSIVTSKVRVRDYNYRTPSTQLKAEAGVAAEGVGVHVYYGEHFKNGDEGKRVAKVRAEEILCRRTLFTGGSRVRGLRAGMRFELEGYPLSDLDQGYVLDEVRHRVAQSPDNAAHDVALQGYHNTFVATLYAAQFRPARATPRPRIHGVVHARIDAAGDDGVTAPIDEMGRYKVLLPFDVAGEGGGKASRWVRMAQSSAGSGYGVHFPLHVGTEVLLSHIDGDPDRPIIVGAVPNPEAASPVNASNATQSQMRTRTGIVVTFDDSAT
jgi:type VI secretion system secreted protein VgrG